MKWTIRKEGIDNYFLEYKDKMFNFHSNVGMVNDLQAAIKNARLRLVKDLSNEGKTIDSLTIKTTTEDGKILYDSSNRNYIEEIYIQEENQRVLEKIIKDMFGMTFEELILDIGITEPEEAKQLATEIGQCLVGRAPRGNEQ